MSPRMVAIRIGWRRGLIELRQSFTNPGELVSHFLWPVLMLIALYFLRDKSFGATGFGLGSLALPSMLGMNAAMGMISMSQQLTADREDGTLLRAKAARRSRSRWASRGDTWRRSEYSERGRCSACWWRP